MLTYLLARNPTDSVTGGFLPAAARLGLDVTVLTDQPAAHSAAYADAPAAPARVAGCAVTDAAAVIDRIAAGRRPGLVFSNSDHLQTQTALAAAYLGLPGKDWRATLRAKNKALTRTHLAAAGLDTVAAVQVHPDDPVGSADDARRLVGNLPFPCVVKPREGVASEDVALVGDPAELAARVVEFRARRPGEVLLVEEFLAGPLHTVETLGDRAAVGVLGGFRTTLSRPPYFVEERLDWCPPAGPVLDSVLVQLAALGVGFGACHTEFVVQGDRARLIEVNYRIIGDHGDFLLADLLGVPVFDAVLRAHLGAEVTAALPDPAAPARHGRLDYVLADRAGVLRAAPAAVDLAGPTLLAYRPLRAVGDRIARTHTNRDYLGVLRVVGADAAAVERAAAEFRAAHRWVVEP